MIKLLHGEYEAGEVLHLGPLSETSRVRSRRSVGGRPLRLKRLRPQLSGDVELTQRWLAAAARNAALPLRASVPVLDWGVTPAGAFVVVEEVAGVSLDRKLKERAPSSPFALASALRITAGVLEALSAAHAASPPLVHLDVHPGSILLDEKDAVTLTEFGAWSCMTGKQHAQHRLATGQVHYCAPEVVNSVQPYDAQSDVFSVGVLLYRLLTGARPYRGESHIEVVLAISRGSHKPTQQAAAGLSEELCAVVDGMLARELGARFRTAQAALTALHEARGQSLGVSGEAVRLREADTSPA